MSLKKYEILRIRDKTDSYYQEVPQLFDLPAKIIINGPSHRSGKTTAMLNILSNPKFGYDKIFKGKNIFIVSNNKLDNKIKLFQEVKKIPDQNIFRYDEDKLEILYEMLEDEFIESVSDNNKPEHKVICFDDVAFSGALKKNNGTGIISKIVMNGRHALISSIFLTQKWSLISTAVRTNITGALLFSTTSKEAELIADDLNVLPKRQDFIKLYRSTTKNKNSFLVVNFSNSIDQMYLDTNFLPLDYGYE